MPRMFKLAMPAFSVMIALSMALTACGGGGAATGGGDNSIVIVIPEDPPSFNPAIADSGYDYLVMELVMLGLADMDPEGNVFPELAAELPTLENGGVGLAPLHNFEDKVSDDVKAELEALTADVAAGNIKVSDYLK